VQAPPPPRAGPTAAACRPHRRRVQAPPPPRAGPTAAARPADRSRPSRL